MAHDIHQYYFEKYLRNEMSIKDRLTFEEKLTVNNQIRSSFEHYKLNRQQYLSDFAIKEQKSASHRKLNNWLYLLISVIGIVLSVNFYLDNKELKQLISSNSGENVPFYKRIPFFFNDKKEAKQPVKQANPITTESDTLIEQSETDTTVQNENSLLFEQDEMLLDTTMLVYEKSTFESVYEMVKLQDSVSSDSILEQLTLQQYQNVKTVFKTIHINVTYWRSPSGYIGYKFNGKKLMLFGITPPFRLTLLKQEDEIGIREEEGNIFYLINDDNFHKF